MAAHRLATRQRRRRGVIVAAAVAALGAVAGLLAVPESITGTPRALELSAARAAEQCLVLAAPLPRRTLLAQLLVVGVDPTGPDAALRAVRGEQVGGIFLGGDSTALLVDGRLRRISAAATLPLTVAVDEEGGRVQRLAALDGDLPSARTMATTMTEAQVRTLAGDRALRMRERGITWDFAPVVDLTAGANVIGDRSFSADPAVTTRYAGAFADGLRDAGMVPVLKHFPGHGRAKGDSHRSAVLTPRIADMAAELRPYRELPRRGPVAVMMGHLDVPGLTDDTPASLHPAAYRLLRDDVGFTGLSVTDDLGSMRAVSDRWDLPDAVVLALRSGADIAFWSSGRRVTEVLDRLESAVESGELTHDRVAEAVERVLRLKGLC